MTFYEFIGSWREVSITLCMKKFEEWDMTTSLLLSKIIDIGEARRRRDQRQAAKAMSSKQERRRNYRRESTNGRSCR